MQNYAYLFLACGLTSAMFTDGGVVSSIARSAKVVGVTFAVLCLGAEAMALLGY